jgi:uncharacterized protein (TIGR02246 family)
MKPLIFAILLAVPMTAAQATPADDERAVADLDIQYQAAVEKNDAAAMDRILAADMILVTGRGKVFTRGDLIKAAREKQVAYEKQVEIEGTQKVRVWGDTAVVTALLWIKYSKDGSNADYKLWFSDTYVRTKRGWRYAFGQASMALPKE